MTVSDKIAEGLSRRDLLAHGLAGVFLLAFHLPVRAAEKPTAGTTEPLPRHALARLGSLGLRHEQAVTRIAFAPLANMRSRDASGARMSSRSSSDATWAPAVESALSGK